MNKRKFIKQNSLVSLIAPIGASKLTQSIGVGLSDYQWKDVIEVARWYPSVHNLHPHRSKVIDDQTAELYYDPQYLLPIGDPASINQELKRSLTNVTCISKSSSDSTYPQDHK